jgi:hypothetical protein
MMITITCISDRIQDSGNISVEIFFVNKSWNIFRANLLVSPHMKFISPPRVQ